MAETKSTYKVNVGDSIPPFQVKDHEGFNINEEDLIGSPVVLYFYPKDETPGCTKEACDFRDTMNQINRFNTIVLGVSPDTQESHLHFIKNQKINFTLLCDKNLDLAKKFDVLREGNKIERTTFVIDSEGVIRWIERPVTVEGHVKRVLEEIKKYSDVDENFLRISDENAQLEAKLRKSLEERAKKMNLPPPSKHNRSHED